MARFLCYATEETYQGLHGIYNIFIDETNSENDAYEDCLQSCIELMESYNSIEEDIREEVLYQLSEGERENEDLIQEAIWDLNRERACPQVWLINEEKAKDIPTPILDKMAYEDMESFIEEYCIQED